MRAELYTLDAFEGNFDEVEQKLHQSKSFEAHRDDRTFSDHSFVGGCATLSSRLRGPGHRRPSMDRSRGPPRQAMPSLLTLEKRRDSCPLWVISGQHVVRFVPKADFMHCSKPCPLLRIKPTLRGRGAGASGVID